MNAPEPERLKVLPELVRGRLPQVVCIAVLVVISTASSLATPMLAGKLVAAIQEGAALTGLAAVLITIGLGTAVAGALATFLVGRMGQHLVFRLRVRTVDRALRMRLADVRREGTGNIASRLTVDTARLKALIDVGPIQLPMAGITLLGTLIIMGILDWVLLLISVAAFAVAIGIITVVVKRLRRTYQAVQLESGGFLQQFMSVMDAAAIIKACRAEQIVSAQIASRAGRLRDLEIRAARMESLMVPVINLGQQIALAAVIIGGGYRLIHGGLTLPDFVAFLLYLLQLTAPLLMAASGVTGIQMGLAARQRFDEIFAMPQEDAGDPPHPVGPVATDTAVRFEQVSVSYDGRPALREANLVVPARGLTAMVGLSGSGKSTSLALIERFISPDEGRVEVLGRPVTEWPIAELRGQLAYVDQTSLLLPTSIRENLQLGRDEPATDAELERALAGVGLLDEVRALPDGLDTVLDGGVDMSGGQRQRLALARALLADARLVLLDEPSSHLDSLNEQRLRDVVDELATDRAVLVVAHRLSTVQHADHVIVLDAGRVVDQGSHAELSQRCQPYVNLLSAQLLENPVDVPA
jgi:ABC-type multidrug transport system fused ATPase/permease subunit